MFQPTLEWIFVSSIMLLPTSAFFSCSKFFSCSEVKYPDGGGGLTLLEGGHIKLC